MSTLYDVFGRSKPGANLRHLGALAASCESLARLYASQLFGRRGENVDIAVSLRGKLQAAEVYSRVMKEHELRSPRNYTAARTASTFPTDSTEESPNTNDETA